MLGAQLDLGLTIDAAPVQALGVCGCGDRAQPSLILEEHFAPHGDTIEAVYALDHCDRCGNARAPWRPATPAECRELADRLERAA